jgi:ferritin-like metal-binding protein YciE
MIDNRRLEMTSQTARDLLVVGLRNAHAMENQAEELMERQVERSGEFPEVQTKLRAHLNETRQQKLRLEECLKEFGESTSTIKDAAMTFTGNLAAAGHAMAKDEILKNALANNAFENYEIAAYKSLLAISRLLGASVTGPLEQSLREEEAMASWIDSHVDEITLAYLRKAEAEAA